MALTLKELEAKKVSLTAQLAKIDVKIAQAGFIDSLAVGTRVYGELSGEEFKNAKILAITAAEGTSGTWYKLRLNEDTEQETVKGVRLSNIHGVEADAEAI
jgi:hypothetical protein